MSQAIEEQKIVRKFRYKGIDIRMASDDGRHWTGETSLGFAVYGSWNHVSREITADIDFYVGESR